MLSWLGEILLTALNLAWSLVWFLVGGWFSTLAQIGVLFSVILFYKYGWQRAPAEIVARLTSLFRLFWNWMRQRDALSMSSQRETLRLVKVKEFGDINLSSLLNILVLFSFILLAMS